MPEGPEVRRHADALHQALAGRRIVEMTARTRLARQWLEQHGSELVGLEIQRVRSHGKHLIGWIESGLYFHSHFMMWGRWQTLVADPAPPVDRRERARIIVNGGGAILTSAPVFDIGQGDPFACVPHLRTIGPDILPYPDDTPWNAAAFRIALLGQPSGTAVGAALLDQQMVAGIGNYLRSEILFCCRIDPWKTVEDLTPSELDCLGQTIPALAARAYFHSGTTVSEEEKLRLGDDTSLVYQPGREYGTRHYVFRRTNLPCLHCGTTVRQLRQVTRSDEEGEHTRITYFCPHCQGTTSHVKAPPARRKRSLPELAAAPASKSEAP